MRAVAIIPARGGSKRIPGKNVKLFAGRPMIGRSIELALRAGCFDRVVVSTDCDRIADIALGFGAEVPFVRPPALADDHTPMLSVVSHALASLGYQGNDLACCICATAPLLVAEDLLRGRAALVDSDADFSVSVTTFPFPIQRAVRVTASGRLAMFDPNSYLTRSQDLEETYHDAAQFYWGRARAFLEEQHIFGNGTIPVAIPRYRVQDIDTVEDWLKAEAMYKSLSELGLLDANRFSG